MTRHAILAILAALALAAPAAAHHTDVPDAISDSDALAVYASEYREQRQALLDVQMQAATATSGTERSTADNAVRLGIAALQDHMDSLDTRACFAEVVALMEAESATLVRAYGAGVYPSIRDAELRHAANIYNAIPSAVFEAVFDCAPQLDGAAPASTAATLKVYPSSDPAARLANGSRGSEVVT